MISFAANHEDVRLARVLTEEVGVYVDVGANHPVEGSVTKHFFDRGWRGLNVEPSPVMFVELERARPSDTNIWAGASSAAGSGRFHFFSQAPGLSTFDDAIASDHALMLGDAEVQDVPLVTLAELFAAHLEAPRIDLLVVDVEGAETDVLRGADFGRWRPRVVVVEATKPLTRTPAHEAWEPILIEAGYVPTAFDGCNRFYVANECSHLCHRLAEPICAFDRYVDHDVLRLVGEVARRFVDDPSGAQSAFEHLDDPRAIVEGIAALQLGEVGERIARRAAFGLR